MDSILHALGELFSPIGQLFHYVFYLPVFNVLMGVYMVVHSFALAIVVLTVLIRVALIPLTRAQLKSQQAMQRLQPELARIKREHPNDPQALMAAQQALYREHGVSPAKGCLPLLIQMPFLYALYYSFYTVLRAPNQATMLKNINADLYPFMPHLNLHTLPDTHFLWANLAQPDPLHILPVLAAVLTFLQLRMAMPVKKPQPRGAQPDATAQATNTMQYMMPAITLFIGLGFPAGLAMYWCISTLFSAIQQYFINGNFGSLFVGVRGMQHLVPPPKDLTVTTPTPPTRKPTRAGASAPPSAPPPAEGGLAGLWKQLRVSMAAQTTSPAESEPTEGPAANGTGGVPPRTPRPTNGASGGMTPRDRRPRPARAGPTLVRPAAPSTPTKPEDEILREGASTRNGKAMLPEEAIARDSAANNGTVSNGTANNGASNRNGTGKGTSPASAPQSTTPPNTQPRASNAQNYRKGSPRRPGGGRPKGSR